MMCAPATAASLMFKAAQCTLAATAWGAGKGDARRRHQAPGWHCLRSSSCCMRHSPAASTTPPCLRTPATRLLKSRHTAPGARAATCPSRLVPAPNATTGVREALHSASARLTCTHTAPRRQPLTHAHDRRLALQALRTWLHNSSGHAALVSRDAGQQRLRTEGPDLVRRLREGHQRGRHGRVEAFVPAMLLQDRGRGADLRQGRVLTRVDGGAG